MADEVKDVVRALWGQYSANSQFSASFRNAEVIRGLIAPTCVDHDRLGEWTGPESSVQWFAPLRTLFPDIIEAFPDIHSTFDALVAEGDRVVMRGSERGTFRNPFRGTTPTGEPVKVTVINIFRVANKQIVEHWAASNLTPLLKMLGTLTPVA